MSVTIATFAIMIVLGFVGYAFYVGGYRDGYHDRYIGYRNASFFVTRRLYGKCKRRYRMKGSRYDL